MKKIFNADILDIFMTETGFIYSCKEMHGGRETASFFSYDERNDDFTRITVTDYITAKYGENGFYFSKQLGDFVTCNLHRINSTTNIAAYDNGTIKVFDNNGIISDRFKVTYNGSPAVSPEPIGKDLWMAVPEENTIINYSLQYKRIEFRIGSVTEKTFSHPTGLTAFNNRLYVCNASSFKIREVGLETFNITDYHIFTEPVYKYIRTDDKEYVILQSGFYVL